MHRLCDPVHYTFPPQSCLTPSVSVSVGQGGRLARGVGKGPGGLDTGLEDVEGQLWRSEGDLMDRELLS